MALLTEYVQIKTEQTPTTKKTKRVRMKYEAALTRDFKAFHNEVE